MVLKLFNHWTKNYKQVVNGQEGRIYRKIPKVSPGAYIFQRPFLSVLLLEGLMYGGKFTFQNWLSWLVVGRKFTIIALFCFVFEGKFQVQAPRGPYIWRDNLTEGFLRYDFGGLIFGGAYTLRGLFSEFYGTLHTVDNDQLSALLDKAPHLYRK